VGEASVCSRQRKKCQTRSRYLTDFQHEKVGAILCSYVVLYSSWCRRQRGAGCLKHGSMISVAVQVHFNSRPGSTLQTITEFGGFQAPGSRHSPSSLIAMTGDDLRLQQSQPWTDARGNGATLSARGHRGSIHST
jgi:hypothetical protein